MPNPSRRAHPSLAKKKKEKAQRKRMRRANLREEARLAQTIAATNAKAASDIANVNKEIMDSALQANQKIAQSNNAMVQDLVAANNRLLKQFCDHNQPYFVGSSTEEEEEEEEDEEESVEEMQETEPRAHIGPNAKTVRMEGVDCDNDSSEEDDVNEAEANDTFEVELGEGEHHALATSKKVRAMHQPKETKKRRRTAEFVCNNREDGAKNDNTRCLRNFDGDI